ncbi:hypothetical protein VNI00_012936 [Paramarasmius palmivorus]|uniref:Uncharacterized protein n=1 Tax=Paramarasmius palmivorus TaxID=297713 RepID=A0AAW0C165_9AGAR
MEEHIIGSSLALVIDMHIYDTRSLFHRGSRTENEANFILAGFGTPSKATVVDPEPRYLAIQRSLLNHIFLNAPRIHHLSLVFRHTDLPKFAFKFASTVQERLESLRHLALFTWGEDPVRALEAFKNSPSLHSTTLSNVDSGNQLPAPRSRNLETLHITDLELLEVDIDHIAILLPKFPYLRSAKLTLWTMSSTLSDEPPKLSLTHVSDLSLGLGHLPSLEIIAALLHSLDIPSLTALHLHAYNEPTLHLQSQFPVFVYAVSALVRRCPNIESLRLDRIPLKDDVLLSMLDDLPGLGVLDVTNMITSLSEGRSVTNHFLKELGSREVVPKLKDLRVLPYATPLEKGVVEGMLSSRRNRAPGFCLQSAYLLVERSAAPMLDLPLLREMQRGGLAVRVATKRKDKEVEVLGYKIGE